MAVARVKIIYGAGGLGYYPLEIGKEYLEILEKYGVKDIDTAFVYPNSEKKLGELGAAKTFAIHTKAPALAPNAMNRESILNAIEKQTKELGVDSVEIYYLHAPDPTTPIEETLDAIDFVYKAGRFHHFGLSNFSPSEVQKVYDICKEKSYPLPTVYQGNYNPVARLSEAELFPLLRKLNMSFNAYSPLAGGFLVKDASLFTSQGTGRWDRDHPIGQMYRTLYGKPTMIAALKEWESIAASAGVSKSSLAYRWVLFHSALKGSSGDGCVVGATQPAQLEETLRDAQAGPLPAEAVERIEQIWKSVEHEAPMDNYANYLEKQKL